MIIPGKLSDSGFIRIPADTGTRYWSITPVDSDVEPAIIFRSEQENIWKSTLGMSSGYPHGYPEGDYIVKLYRKGTEDSLVASGRVTAHEGLVSAVCFENEGCLDYPGE